MARVYVWTLEVSLPACHLECGEVFSNKALAAGQREEGREKWRAKAPVVCSGGEIAGVGTESSQYLGTGPSSLSPCFLAFPCPIPVATTHSSTLLL